MKRIWSAANNAKELFFDIAESLRISWRASRLIFAFSVLCQCCLMVSPIVVAYYFKVATNEVVLLASGRAAELKALVYSIAIMVIFQLSELAVQMITEDLKESHGNKIWYYVHTVLLKKITELDISYFDDPSYYNSLSAAMRDSDTVITLSTMAISMIRQAVQIITCSVILFDLTPFIPFFIVIFMIPFALIKLRFVKYKIAYREAKIENDRHLIMTENILREKKYAKDLRFYHNEDHFFSRYKMLWEKGYTEKKRLTRKKISMYSITNAMPYLIVGAVLIYIAARIYKGFATVGDFAYYKGITSQLIAAFNSFVMAVSSGGECMDKMKKIKSFLSAEPILKNEGEAVVDRIESIVFEDVSFRYPNTNSNVLNNINLTLSGDKLYSLVGRNGAGKSTFVKLLLRLYDPTEGRILINGIDLKEIKTEEYHKLLSVMFQDYNIYLLTVRENIALAELDRKNNDYMLERACENGSFDIKQKKYKNGYDTYIGRYIEKDGALLSGGENQKLAISRAYFKENTAFYIMDEPNSALDPEAEDRILSKLIELTKNKGGLFITHRMSTVTVADEILVLDKGALAESGTHAELMDKNGLFAKLFRAQADKFSADNINM